MTYPPNDTVTTLAPPFQLSWSVPDPFPQLCEMALAYQVSLSQEYPPQFFQSVDDAYLYIKNINEGLWFWTVTAVTPWFSSSSYIFSFQVVIFIIS